MAAITLTLAGDVMTGRGIDQIMRHPSAPGLHEDYVKSALDYVRLAEAANGPISRDVPSANSAPVVSRIQRRTGASRKPVSMSRTGQLSVTPGT